MSAPRIALIHATPASIAPIEAAFAQHWPAARDRLQSILDDSLSRDAAEAGDGLGPAFTARMLDLCGYAVRNGADGVLFTCSAFGSCIERCVEVYGPKPRTWGTGDKRVPVLKPNEAMMEEAIDAAAVAAQTQAGDPGGHRPFTLAVLATFAPTIPSIRSELEALALARGLRDADLVIETQHVPGAMQALLEGDQERHDRLVAAAAASLPSSCSLVLLSQYSMACAESAAAEAMAAAGTRAAILTSPKSAVLKLARLLQQDGGTK